MLEVDISILNYRLAFSIKHGSSLSEDTREKVVTDLDTIFPGILVASSI